MLGRVFGCCRVVFNDALRVRDEAYRAGVKVSDSEIQRRVITQAKTTAERAWLGEVPSVALVQSVNDSRRAWRNFFDSRAGKRKGRKVGRPRMKSRRITGSRFGLPATDSGPAQWSVVCGEGRRGAGALVARTAQRAVEGHDHPRTGRPLLRQLRRRRRRPPLPAASAKPGWMSVSPGWRRSPTPTARAPTSRIRSTWPASCANCGGWSGRSPAGRKDQQQGQDAAQGRHRAPQGGAARRDYHHKQALALVRENQVIHVEDLNIVGMVRNRRLARAIRDAGWGQFVRIIAEKADRYGRTVHTVSRWLASSKTCSACGHQLDELPLQVRAVDVPGVPGGPRPRPQRRQDHSRRRAGGETKRLPRKWAGPRKRFRWSPSKTSLREARGR